MPEEAEYKSSNMRINKIIGGKIVAHFNINEARKILEKEPGARGLINAIKESNRHKRAYQRDI